MQEQPLRHETDYEKKGCIDLKFGVYGQACICSNMVYSPLCVSTNQAAIGLQAIEEGGGRCREMLVTEQVREGWGEKNQYAIWQA